MAFGAKGKGKPRRGNQQNARARSSAALRLNTSK